MVPRSTKTIEKEDVPLIVSGYMEILNNIISNMEKNNG